MVILLIICGIIILEIAISANNKNKEKEKREEDKRWLSETKISLETEHYGKKPYYYAYKTPPSINGDFYMQSTEKEYKSPHYNFIICYHKCIYENSASCVNCTRRNQITWDDGYHYGSSNLCYDIKELDMED